MFERKGMGYDDATCDAVKDLTDALQDKGIQDLMKEFDSIHANDPNYIYWTTYIEMVEILLDFIRANRDGN